MRKSHSIEWRTLIEPGRIRDWVVFGRQLGSRTGEPFGMFVFDHPSIPGFKIKVIVSAGDGPGGGWDHVSVSFDPPTTTPTWEDMCWVKNLFFEDEETVVQFHPAKSDYVNIHPHCLHLWRPINQPIALPPKAFV